MGVRKNNGTQIIHFNRVFHYKPSILGYPYFWKHPNGALMNQQKHRPTRQEFTLHRAVEKLRVFYQVMLLGEGYVFGPLGMGKNQQWVYFV